MMLTEDEAKTKWCPMVRHDMDGGFNRFHSDGTAPASATCIGSACMMWRWNEYTDQYRHYRHSEPPEGEGWERTAHPGQWRRKNPNRGGFCGLAGKPEYF